MQPLIPVLRADLRCSHEVHPCQQISHWLRNLVRTIKSDKPIYEILITSSLQTPFYESIHKLLLVNKIILLLTCCCILYTSTMLVNNITILLTCCCILHTSTMSVNNITLLLTCCCILHTSTMLVNNITLLLTCCDNALNIKSLAVVSISRHARRQLNGMKIWGFDTLQRNHNNRYRTEL